MRKIVSDVLIIAGMTMVICGLYQVYAPLAWLAGGAWCAVTGATYGMALRRREANQ